MKISNNFYKVFVRNKSKIYSVIILISPLLIFAIQKNEWGGVNKYFGIAIGLIVAASFAGILPKYVVLGIKLEDFINLKLAQLTPSRLMRILFHLPILIGVYVLYQVFGGASINYSTFLLLLAASNGLHAASVTMAYHGIGDRVGNILLSLALSSGLIAISLASTYGLKVCWFAALIFGIHIAIGLLSDIRAYFYPKSGVGIYFGTFNPIHKTHLKIIAEVIKRRGLHKVYIHSTTVPKLHRMALAHNEIEMKIEEGMRVYAKTELADPSKNYFPTGNKFYEYEIRKELIKAGVSDTNLSDYIEVLDLPDIYEQRGFFGVIDYIKKHNPKGVPIHGIHGSDTGGIWVRNIFDSSGWIYPYPVIRADNISATSIREGAVGYTSPTIEAFLVASRAGKSFKFPSGYIFNSTSITPTEIGNKNVNKH